jgi:fused signal recognition particle receptor
MKQQIINVLENIIDSVPDTIFDKITIIFNIIPPIFWWAIIAFFTFLFFLLQIVRLIKKIRSRRQKAAVEAAKKNKTDTPVKKAPVEEIQAEREQIVKEPVNFFERLKNGLSKTRKTFSGSLDTIFADNKKIDDDMLEEIEELLITSDIGVPTTMKLVERISEKASEISDIGQLKSSLKEDILSFLKTPSHSLKNSLAKPHVIMVVGVNGVGKTTTIGKLAARYTKEGKKVLIAASDTFRAAASEQLTIWAERAGADIVKHGDNADPSAVAYDSVEAAIARGSDIVLIDTAGRLHTRKNLMEEMKKINRTIGKKIPEAPHETLLVLDATTGQNALTQAKLFLEAISVTGIALTKLDGTAKGGIVVSICSDLNIPLAYIGVGEQAEDLQDFDPKQFVDALF